MKDQINYDDFVKLDIRIATVIAVDLIEGADRLLKLTLDVGDLTAGGLGQRVIVSGIKEWYQPDDLLGKQIVYLANLEPRLLRGVESQGMVLAADGEQAVLLRPWKAVNNGSMIK